MCERGEEEEMCVRGERKGIRRGTDRSVRVGNICKADDKTSHSLKSI